MLNVRELFERIVIESEEKKLEIVVGEKLGGLKCVIFSNMVDCEIEKIGRAKISYASRRPNRIIINNIEINKYDAEANNNFYKVAEQAGVKIRKEGFSQNGFSLNEQQKKLIAETINKKYENFVRDIENKKIKIYISIVGFDFPHAVLTIKEKEYEGMEVRDFFHYWADEEHHIYNAYKWLSKDKQKDGEDVTSEVQAELKRRREVVDKNLSKRQQFFDEAKRTGKK